jgi:hypothetical protein
MRAAHYSAQRSAFIYGNAIPPGKLPLAANLLWVVVAHIQAQLSVAEYLHNAAAYSIVRQLEICYAMSFAVSNAPNHIADAA